MVRVCRALKICQVAGHAARIGQRVIVIDVALGTLQRSVRSGQWEACGGVVERGIGP